MRFVPEKDLPIFVPESIAVCPVCGKEIIIEDVDEWDAENGCVTETGLHFTCSTEPDIDSEDWDRWFNIHYNMPYVDWLPLQDRVWMWFNANFRVDVK